MIGPEIGRPHPRLSGRDLLPALRAENWARLLRGSHRSPDHAVSSANRLLDLGRRNWLTKCTSKRRGTPRIAARPSSSRDPGRAPRVGASIPLSRHDAFTSPEFRGLGASPARLREMMRYYRDRGYRCLLGAVLPENKASLRLSEGVGGYRHIGVIGYVGLGPWRHVFCRMERDASPPGRARRAP